MTTVPNKDIYPEDQIWLDAQLAKITFGSLIKSHRLCEAWSQEQAANKLGVSKQLYNAYERDRRLPTPKKAAEIAQALGIVPEMLVLTVLNDQLRKDNFPFQVSIAS